MMKIIILSDIHMLKRAKKLPAVLLNELNECDLIIHAGDWQSTKVYEKMRAFVPVEGVYGNTDSGLRPFFQSEQIQIIIIIVLGIVCHKSA
ncbi:metallophosphoesterase family protein [Cytobacillus sp. NCCP-133]|uniref:metallophosphoesterase family protein n=1 Tax=Cytobacillus sp. NCCP-133 TaxID=766848 RepID=UPI00222E6853|nr:metallophosphoesterase family protein [Cytobacillus sp. NCCP-133]GLB61106.1 hypothetical protein NCCP133_32360 [Cytobacillus sp. NCCP-133]